LRLIRLQTQTLSGPETDGAFLHVARLPVPGPVPCFFFRFFFKRIGKDRAVSAATAKTIEAHDFLCTTLESTGQVRVMMLNC